MAGQLPRAWSTAAFCELIKCHNPARSFSVAGMTATQRELFERNVLRNPVYGRRRWSENYFGAFLLSLRKFENTVTDM